jgi:S-adenosylmethionine:tRNA ribosyltransferase-isomerase
VTAVLEIGLPPGRAAHQPPEARGLARDGVRLLVGGPDGISHHRFTDLPELLVPGDVLVVNRSATMPAAVDVAGTDLVVHVSTARPDGTWLVELRHRDRAATVPYRGGSAGDRLPLAGGAGLTLRGRFRGGRLWVADLDARSVPGYLRAHGRPIRYGYVTRDWPLSAYQTVFATEPAGGDRAGGDRGSAEMPSAGRPFTTGLVTRLATAGVVFAPVTLHTGVASLEAPEPPYPEWFEVPPVTARLVSQARQAGRRVVAVGTTAVRALESAAGRDGSVRPASGWTELVITPTRGVRVVNGLLTGFHEPQSSHLQLLAAVVGEPLLARCYAEAVAGDYRWHEFGDLNLLLG